MVPTLSLRQGPQEDVQVNKQRKNEQEGHQGNKQRKGIREQHRRKQQSSSPREDKSECIFVHLCLCTYVCACVIMFEGLRSVWQNTNSGS